MKYEKSFKTGKFPVAPNSFSSSTIVNYFFVPLSLSAVIFSYESSFPFGFNFCKNLHVDFNEIATIFVR